MHLLLDRGIKVHTVDSHAAIGAEAKHIARLAYLSLTQQGNAYSKRKKKYSLIHCQ